MRAVRGWMAATSAAALLGCDGGTRAIEPRTAVLAGLVAQDGASGARATGGGHYVVAGFLGQISLSAVQRDGESATGAFHHRVVFGDVVADISGRLTCLAVDSEHHRAWIGGVVTQNKSTDPDVLQDIHQPGRDVWFRVVDYGPGGSAAQPDRTTFLGFEGAAGFITSAEYCAGRPWPDGDARTWPVTTGNLTVAP